MYLCTWNVRGLNNPCKRIEVKRFINQNKLTFIAQLETRVKQHNSTKVMKKFENNWKWEDNYDYSERGRIWLAWNPAKIMVNVILKSSQFIHESLFDKGSGLQICFTAVYGLHTVETRKPLWQDLLRINGAINSP